MLKLELKSHKSITNLLKINTLGMELELKRIQMKLNQVEMCSISRAKVLLKV